MATGGRTGRLRAEVRGKAFISAPGSCRAFSPSNLCECLI